MTATDMPALWEFGTRAARGALSVKAADDRTDCADGLITLGAGIRATGTPAAEQLCEVSDGRLSEDVWAGVQRANDDENYGTKPGLLADTLAAHRIDGQIYGDPVAWLSVGPTPATFITNPLGFPGLTLFADTGLYDVTQADRLSARRAVDARLGWLSSLEPSTVVLVVGASDARTGPRTLHVAMAAGPGFRPGSLTSDSTGRSPYVQLIDVAPTVLHAFGIDSPDDMAGEPWESTGGPTSMEQGAKDLTEADEVAVSRGRWSGWFVDGLVGAGILCSVIAGTVLAIRPLRRHASARAVAEGFCYVVAATPVASWVAYAIVRWRHGATALWVATSLIAVGLAAIAFVVARRRSPWGGLIVIAGVSVAVLALDFVSGTRLQSESLLGDSTLVAGRFRGAGNTATAVFATSILVSVGVLAVLLRDRGHRRVVTIATSVSVIAVVLVAAPFLGNDFGGLLALVPAATLLVLALAGVRGRWLAPAAVGVGAAAALVVLGFDAVSGGGHIGRFTDQVADGDAGVTLRRKLAANLDSWHTSPYVAMVLVSLLVLALLARPGGPLARALGGWDALRMGLLAAAVCAVLGGVLNDSGAVVPGAAAIVAIPLILAGCVRSTT